MPAMTHLPPLLSDLLQPPSRAVASVRVPSWRSRRWLWRPSRFGGGLSCRPSAPIFPVP